MKRQIDREMWKVLVRRGGVPQLKKKKKENKNVYSVSKLSSYSQNMNPEEQEYLLE